MYSLLSLNDSPLFSEKVLLESSSPMFSIGATVIFSHEVIVFLDFKFWTTGEIWTYMN